MGDSCLRLKGLDRPFVIVTELDEQASNRYDTRMHIALTRTTVHCVRVATDVALAADGRLSGLRDLLTHH